MSNPSVGSAADTNYLLNKQYRDSRKLEARANLHSRHGVAGPNWFQWVIEHAALTEGNKVLDIGCGPGWLWDQAQQNVPPGLELTLADLSPGMVDGAVNSARQTGRYAQVEGVVADAAALPFADASFDAVLACHMIYHVPDAPRALREFQRVLKPGGVVAVTTNLEGNMAPFYALGAAAFGGEASDPAANVMGLRRVESLMRDCFGEVTVHELTGALHVTSVDDLVLALTSFPPGDGADDTAVGQLFELASTAVETGGGKFVIPKTQGMVRGIEGS